MSDKTISELERFLKTWSGDFYRHGCEAALRELVDRARKRDAKLRSDIDGLIKRYRNE